MAENRVIGDRNRLPWHLPADLKRFRALTWGKPLLMGRKTHESIGKPLPGRMNLVLTRDPDYRAPGCVVVHSLDRALSEAGTAPELMVIGGAEVYAALLPQATRLYLTTIHRVYAGDVFFPPLETRAWSLLSHERVEHDDLFDAAYSFAVLERTAPVLGFPEPKTGNG